MKLCFSEKDWAHEVVSDDGSTVLASVYSPTEAIALKLYYERVEQMARIEAEISNDENDWSWRSNDELGGE